jgi:predicted XRE-type DNA-binding protein
MSEKERFVASSGNVFADLGFDDPEAEMARAELAIQIRKAIEERGITQANAGAILGIDQPKVSLLMRGRTSGFSLERLMTLLNRLGCEVEINVYPPTAGRTSGHTSVHAYEESQASKTAKREKAHIS